MGFKVETRFDPEQELWFYQTGKKSAMVIGPVRVKDLAITAVLEPDDSVSYHEEYVTYCDKTLVWHSNMDNDVEIFASKKAAEAKLLEAKALLVLEAGSEQ